MILIGKQWYADNFPARALARKEQVGWVCERCYRVHGQECAPDMVQLALKGCKRRKKQRKRKIVVIAHHPNYDTENPDAELIILCRACHGKEQKQHNHEVHKQAANAKKIAEREDEKGKGQLELTFDEEEYEIIQINFPVSQFLQHTPT